MNWFRQLLGDAPPPWAMPAATVAIALLVAYGAKKVYGIRSQSSGRGTAVMGKALLSGIDVEKQPLEAINCANAAIASGSVNSAAELVAFLRGTNTKRITLPESIVGEMSSATFTGRASFTTEQKRLWDRALAQHRLLRALDSRRRTAFREDSSDVDALIQLWSLAGLHGPFERRSDEWNRVGFQGMDPTTDFRGGGMLALDHILSFAQHHGVTLQRMMAYNAAQQEEGEHSWYLTAVVSIQFSVQLLSEKDHPFHLRQLRVLYDDVGTDGETLPPSNSSTGVIVASDGMRRLHHALMLHFRACWERDQPHVMEYNTYMPTVYASFFAE